jgi:oxygen-dependent protoporphyrinogen oxidase
MGEADCNQGLSAVVIGAGVSGLTAAYKLSLLARQQGTRLTLRVFESSGSAGGVIGTVRHDDALIERGPESFVTYKPQALQLAKELGLSERLVSPSQESKRTFVGFDNRLHPLPDGFVMFAPTRLAPLATSSLFSWQGKMRMAMDLALPPRRDGQDESVAEFVRRRLGQEALERLAEPLIGGIYSADPEWLSAQSAVPKLCDLERQCGSLIRGLWKSTTKKPVSTMGERPEAPQFLTFDSGLQVLIDALVERLPPGCLRFNTTITCVTRGRYKRWSVVLNDGRTVECDLLVIAAPARAAGLMLLEVERAVAEELLNLTYGSAAIMTAMFDRKNIEHALDGSGFVVPYVEGKTLSACSFSSVKFARRAPQGKILLRAFAGGGLNSEAYGLNDEELCGRLLEDIHAFIGVKREPLFTVLTRHPLVMPQYTVGHKERIAGVEEHMRAMPGIALAGNAYRGVGISDCIASADQAANKVWSQLPAYWRN